MRTLKLGIIGCGSAVEYLHLPALQRIPKIKVKALVDKYQDRAKNLSQRYNLNAITTSDYSELLKDDAIDAILIATPPDTHAQIAIDGAKAGKHIFCEKPMSTSLEDAEKIIHTVSEENVKFMMGFNFRYSPEIIRIKKMVDSGFVGKPMMMSLYFLSNISNWPSVTKFQFNKKKGGGVLFDTGSHPIDLARWIFNDIQKVYCTLSTSCLNSSVDDTAALLLETKKGEKINIFLSWCSKDLNRISIIGTEGILETETGLNHVLAMKKGVRMGQFRIMIPTRTQLPTYQLELSNFANIVLNNEIPLVTGKDGLESLKVILAAYQSYETSKPVIL